MTRATANAYALIGLAIVIFWLAVFGIPAARAIVEAATTRPDACVTLTGSDCAALMSEKR